MKKNYHALGERLGYQFNKTALLKTALSHRSFQADNNERLEFLGDSIVNFLIAEVLFQRYPQASEGDLSRLRAKMVRGETLAELAQDLDIGPYLCLGSGELKSGGRSRQSILADAMEAIIAAIYLDSNLEQCRHCVQQWFASRLEQLSSLKEYKDPKSSLQEYLQARKFALPQYEVLRIEGEAHEQVFHVKCHSVDLDLAAEAKGSSRRRAEQQAAENILMMLNDKKGGQA